MQSSFASLALAALLASLAGCSNQPVDGDWTGTWKVSPAEGALTVTLTQEGTNLGGKVNAADSMCWTDGVVVGTLTGEDVLFGVLTSNGAELKFDGTLSSDGMTGTFLDKTGCTGQSGDWTLSRK
ncbi:MAG: hypothetical protein U0359_19365 [Byssovorax sp.]